MSPSSNYHRIDGMKIECTYSCLLLIVVFLFVMLLYILGSQDEITGKSPFFLVTNEAQEKKQVAIQYSQSTVPSSVISFISYIIYHV